MPTKTPAPAYDSDLALIHDAGFGHVARAAASGLLSTLKQQKYSTGTVVELGCGSGILSEVVARAGYDVVGYDISPAMIDLARQRVPDGRFNCQSFVDVELPGCVAVTAVGEIFNYLFDRRNTLQTVIKVWRRIFKALSPGGVLLFDMALVGRIPAGQVRTYAETEDWACLYEGVEQTEKKTLERRITTFVRDGAVFRRAQELHRLRLYEQAQLVEPLKHIGFRVRPLKAYGDWKFPPGWRGFLCLKPR
jgi:SAM-dependent methyltransferase